MNARNSIGFGPRMVALALVAGIPVAYADAPEQGPVIIGVALPQVHLGQGPDAAEPLRQAVMNRFRSQGLEPVALVGSTAAEIDAEARGKGCSQVLYTDVERKHGVGGFLSKLAPLAGVLPSIAGASGGSGGGGSGVTGLLTQVAANAATSAAASSAQRQLQGAQPQGLESATGATIKRGDSITFDYRLAPIGGGTPIKSDTFHAKADADGQDVLTPIVAQLAQAVSPQGLTGASATPADAGRAEHTGFLHGLIGARTAAASPPVPAGALPAAGGTPDCAQIASMPNAPFSFETCQKMMGAQQAYNRAAADPTAWHPGDEQMSCDAIKAELRRQQISAPDKAKVAETTAAVTKEQGMLDRHLAEANAVMAEEQVKVNAAVAADQAAGMASGGLVRTNATTATAMAEQARIKELGERQAAERRPTEQKMYGGVADLGVGAAQQFASNPRLARLMQLAQSHGCKGI
jgi:hypothetical protein